jgi:tetratricopeptide (TPR) repeat protein
MINTYTNRARSRNILGDQRGAIEDYTKYIEMFQGNPDAYNDRGLCKHALKDTIGAYKDFTMAIKVGEQTASPNLHLYYINRGVVEAQMKKFENALHDYTKAIEISPTYAQGLFNLGNLQIYLGKKTEGCETLKKAASLGNAQAVTDLEKYCK